MINLGISFIHFLNYDPFPYSIYRIAIYQLARAAVVRFLVCKKSPSVKDYANVTFGSHPPLYQQESRPTSVAIFVSIFSAAEIVGRACAGFRPAEIRSLSSTVALRDFHNAPSPSRSVSARTTRE